MICFFQFTAGLAMLHGIRVVRIVFSDFMRFALLWVPASSLIAFFIWFFWSLIPGFPVKIGFLLSLKITFWIPVSMYFICGSIDAVRIIFLHRSLARKWETTPLEILKVRNLMKAHNLDTDENWTQWTKEDFRVKSQAVKLAVSVAHTVIKNIKIA